MTERELKRQPRAKVMLPGIKQLITVEATTSNKKREKLANELIARIKKEYPEEIPPVEETVIKLISRARNHELPPLDKAWNLGELSNLHKYGIYNFNAEVVAHIIRVQIWVHDNFFRIWEDKHLTTSKKKGKAQGLDLLLYMSRRVSIRQAKWISVLYRIIRKDIPYLWFASFIYTYYEVICEISETTFDTSNLDLNIKNVKTFKEIAQSLIHHEMTEEALQRLFNIGRLKGEEK